jgi:hypothetical protein
MKIMDKGYFFGCSDKMDMFAVNIYSRSKTVYVGFVHNLVVVLTD